MCGGGGSPPPAPVRDPQAEAQAQLQLEQERARIAEQQRLAAEERERQEQQRLLEEFNTNLGAAKESTFSRGTNLISERGLDPSEFESMLRGEIDQVARGIPLRDPNPSSYFQDNIVDTILGRETTNRRRGFEQDIQGYAPQGFARERLPDTFDDAVLSAILDEQYAPAQQSILNAQARGNLSDSGFQSAQELLGSQRTAADARLQQLGGGVLEQGRGDLREIADQAYSGASSYELGDTFDPNRFKGQIDDRFGEFSGGLEGNIRNTLGGEGLFDIGRILQQAGINQGVHNPATSGSNPNQLLDAFANRDGERNQRRGLSSQGTF